MPWKASCLYCRYSIELPERPTPKKGFFCVNHYPAPGFGDGVLYRLDGTYRGCCSQCSAAINRGEMELSMLTSGAIGARRVK